MNTWKQFYDDIWGYRKFHRDFPAEPWRWKAEWNDPRGIPPRTSSRGRKACAIGGAIFVGLTALLAVGLVAAEQGAYPPIPGNQIFLAASGTLGLALFYLAWRTPSAREERFLLRFIPVSLPLPLQGEVAGMIVVPRPISPTAPSRVYLYCQRRELIEQERRSDEDHEARFREAVEKISDAPESSIPVEEWRRSVNGTQAIVQIPIDGNQPSTTTALSLNHPVIEWLLRVDIPAAEGALRLEFLLPVFGSPGSSDSRASSLAGALSELEVQQLVPTVAPPIAARDREEILRSAGIVPTPRAEAVGHTALCLDRKSARTAAVIIWLGYPVAILFTVIITGMLLYIPILGWLAATALIIYAAYSIVTGAFRMLTRRKGPETLWVESGALCSEDAATRVLRVPRTEIDRIEVVPVGSAGSDRYFKLLAAGSAGAGSPVRARQVLAEAVRTREAAQAVGHWLSERLGEPHPKVVNTEEGWALVEKFAAWQDRRKA